MKKLNLKKETLFELDAEDLRQVIGGAESQSCPITYKCVNVSENGCNISNNCTNISNVCTFIATVC